MTLRNNRLNFVDFYLITDDGIQTLTAGDRRPFPDESRAAYPTFHFQLLQGEAGTIYVRVQSDTEPPPV